MAQTDCFAARATKILSMRPLAFSCLICATLFVTPSMAQVRTDSLSSDRLFMMARDKAFDGDRKEARRLCRIINARDSMYMDARVLLARTYAWDGNNAEGRSILKSVLSVVPTHRDALEALTDVELWGKDFLQALAVANEGLFSYPHDEDLLIKKARALDGLGRDEESLQILLKVEEIDPSRS